MVRFNFQSRSFDSALVTKCLSSEFGITHSVAQSISVILSISVSSSRFPASGLSSTDNFPSQKADGRSGCSDSMYLDAFSETPI